MHDLIPNLKLTREPLIICPPKPLWPTPYTISHQLSSPCSRNNPPPFATLLLFPTYSLYATATSLPGLMARFLAGWGRVVQGSTLNVGLQSVLLLPPSPSRLESGPPATVLRCMPSYMLLSGASLTPCAFESVTLFCDSLSVLSILSVSLPYLTLKSLFDTQLHQ